MPSADLRTNTGDSGQAPGRSIPWGRVLIGIALVAAIVVAARAGADRIPELLRRVDALGPWAAVAFVGIYAVAAVAWIPDPFSRSPREPSSVCSRERSLR